MGLMRREAEIGEPTIAEDDFRAIAAIVRDMAGIVLGPSKRELVCGRLARRLRALGLRDFAHYRVLLESPEGDSERDELINAITTNLTSFFREKHHFDHLGREVLPELLNGTEPRLRLWSAACSSGEEAYSMAMILQKALGKRTNRDARILATDIDTTMVRTGAAGIYDAERARTIPSEFAGLVRAEHDGFVEMADSLKTFIAFKSLNLLGAWPMRGKFHGVFCRNVVIYFDKPTQRQLFDRIADILVPGGHLYIGHSETLFGVSDRFEPLGRTIYRKLR